jgi:hypothetical protein
LRAARPERQCHRKREALKEIMERLGCWLETGEDAALRLLASRSSPEYISGI